MTTTTTNYEGLLKAAVAAGWKAAREATPTPMTVYEADGLTDRPKPGGKSWYVSEGVCGFAWVTLRPATTGFARWLRKHRMADRNDWGGRDALRSTNEAEGGSWSKGYHGGYEMWVWAGGQSLARKEAFARAFADVLKDAGYTTYVGSRMD